jgi:hypothetical protein
VAELEALAGGLQESAPDELLDGLGRVPLAHVGRADELLEAHRLPGHGRHRHHVPHRVSEAGEASPDQLAHP